MNALSKLATFLSLLALSAQAQAIEFSFLSGSVGPEAFGNSYSTTVDGLTLTATAWSAGGRGVKFRTAELEIYPGAGMGVCSRREGVDCSTVNNQHGLDNKYADELILFSFSSSVQLDTLAYQQLGRDSDFSLWAGTGNLSLNGMTPYSLGTATLVKNRNRASTLRTLDLGTPLGGSYDWLIVAARIGQENDNAMLRSLAVNPVTVPAIAQPVPEAETWAMLLVGLGLVGFAARRRA